MNVKEFLSHEKCIMLMDFIYSTSSLNYLSSINFGITSSVTNVHDKWYRIFDRDHHRDILHNHDVDTWLSAIEKYRQASYQYSTAFLYFAAADPWQTAKIALFHASRKR